MKKISARARRSFEDALWRETKTEWLVKHELMTVYRFPARKAKQATLRMLKDAIQYWAYEDVC